MPTPTIPEIIQTLDKADVQITRALSRGRETPIMMKESDTLVQVGSKVKEAIILLIEYQESEKEKKR